MIGNKVWSAVPMVILTVLLAGVAVILMIGNNRTAAPSRPAAKEQAAPVAMESKSAPARSGAVSKAVAVVASQAGVDQAPQPKSIVRKPANRASTKPAARPAGKSVTRQAAGPADAARPDAHPKQEAPAGPMANNLGWRLGTEWTVKVEEYATYLLEPKWVSTTYRFKVVAADEATKTFTVSMRFADPSIQPESARGDLLVAGYRLRNGAVGLGWVQPEGTGPQLGVAESRSVLGKNKISLELPASPLEGGRTASALAPGLGTVKANKVALGENETASFAPGAPWWLSYQKGKNLKAQLTGFTR